MRAVLPGRPAATLQALCSAYWDGLRVIVGVYHGNHSHVTNILSTQVYVSGNAFVILNEAQELLQTIYIDDASSLAAVAIEESSGCIAVAGASHVYIYEPRGREEGLLQVCILRLLSSSR